MATTISSTSTETAATLPRARSQPALSLHDLESTSNVYHFVGSDMPRVVDPKERERIEDQAIELICDIRFHRSFILEADSTAGRPKPLRITYSDAGSSAPNAPVFLWASGMFGGRYSTRDLIELATSHGIRVIAIDRPGIGGSEAVPITLRISTWLAVVPALLKHLGIKNVSLGCHSAGTIYILSTIIHLRHLLHPERPYVCMFGPWVMPEFSGKWDMRIVSKFPRAVLAQWHLMAKTVYHIDKRVQPGIEQVKTMHRKVKKAINRPSSGTINTVFSTDATSASDEFKDEFVDTLTNGQRVLLPDHGPLMPLDLLIATNRLTSAAIFAENVQGASDEALICMGKAHLASWTNIGDALESIATNELARKMEDGSVPKLRIDVFYAAKDQMIGKGGEEFLESCLDRAYAQGAIDCSSMVIGNTDHNSVLSPASGVCDLVFKAMKMPPQDNHAREGESG